MLNWTGQRVTVMGLGRHGGGVAATRYLAEQGAIVTVTDLADADTLRDSLESLSGVPIAEVRLGEHRKIDFRAADAVVVNPAVRPSNEYLQIAHESGAVVTSEIEIFLNACRAPIIGVTGTNGKSTTAAMIAAILEVDGRRTFFGGNIGSSLLPELNSIQPDDWAVLELSSFQLFHLSPRYRPPNIAVVTNCSPNHLDWHATYDDYRDAKKRILGRLATGCRAVINAADPEVRSWISDFIPPANDSSIPTLQLPGAHNRANAALAAATAQTIGCSQSAITIALKNFRGLQHRLQFVAKHHGRAIINDSKATTPESTIAALQSLDARVWLLAGGYDKGSPFDELADEIIARAAGVALVGQAGQRLSAAIRNRAPKFSLAEFKNLPTALDWCWTQSKPGDTILLSPACASFGEFRDFAHRGNEFMRLASAQTASLRSPAAAV